MPESELFDTLRIWTELLEKLGRAPESWLPLTSKDVRIGKELYDCGTAPVKRFWETFR